MVPAAQIKFWNLRPKVSEGLYWVPRCCLEKRSHMERPCRISGICGFDNCGFFSLSYSIPRFLCEEVQLPASRVGSPIGQGFCGMVQAIPGEFPLLPCQGHPGDVRGIHDHGCQGQCCNASLDQRRYLFRTLHAITFRTAVYISYLFRHLLPRTFFTSNVLMVLYQRKTWNIAGQQKVYCPF